MVKGLVLACFLIVFPPPFEDWLALLTLVIITTLLLGPFTKRPRVVKGLLGITLISLFVNTYLQINYTFPYQTQLYLPMEAKNDGFESAFLDSYPREHWCDETIRGCWRNTNNLYQTFAVQSSSTRKLSITSFREVGTALPFAGYQSKSGDTNFYDNDLDGPNISRANTPFIFTLPIVEKMNKYTFCSDAPFYLNDDQLGSGCYDIEDYILPGTIRVLHLKAGQNFSLKPSAWVQGLLYFHCALKFGFLALLVALFNFRELREFRQLIKLSPAFILFIFLIKDGYAYQFPLFRGGDDGLLHASLGNNILHYLKGLNLAEAFRGGEDVFYYMPGLRYFWPAFIMVFGYTAFPFVLLLSVIPLLCYHLALALKLKYPSLIFTIAFIHLFSFERFAINGFPEVLSYPLFLAGLTLYFRARDQLSFISFTLLTLAVFVRPNLVLSVFFMAVMSLPWLLKNYKRIWIYLGCLPVFFTLIHNAYFSGEFVLFTSSALIEANLLCSPRCYLQGSLDLLNGQSTAMSEQMLTQLRALFYPLTKSVLLIAFALRLIFYRGLSRNQLIFGGAIVMLFFTQIFWHSYGRYIWLTQLFMLMFISQDVVKLLFTSSRDEDFPLKKTIELINKLKRLNPNLRGVNALKFFYRPFIFPLYPMLENVKPDDHILDIGCGSGFFLCAVNIETGATKLHGLEIDPKLVSLAQNNAKVELFDGLNCNQAVAKADLIFLNDVYHHVPAQLRKEFLHNIASSMKPGARLVFKDINGSSLIWKLFNKLHDFIFSGEMGSEISLKEARELVLSQGLRIEEQYTARHAIYNHFILVCSSSPE
jgi:2-polyprenyl-3-methyl-5-hydroxy-6-metoxy-1,4-benzoquinol methylase